MESEPIVIPHSELSAQALAGVIAEYVTRDGTEFGEVTEKSEVVAQLLERGELVLVYDPDSESCNIITRDQLAAARKESQGASAGQYEPGDPS
jgi:uncharacterized protein YheU (UPF0270 family)